MWTAWQLLELEPNLDLVLLDASLCGHGPSGRNGGFCETLWGDVDTLRERSGDAAALAVCRASEEAVHGIGAWCAANEVDAWYRHGADAPRRDDRVAARLVGRRGARLRGARRPGRDRLD